MARAQGARSQLAAAFETTYGTAPTTGFMKIPFASASLGAEQPLLTSELLGYGRDPLAPLSVNASIHLPGNGSRTRSRRMVISRCRSTPKRSGSG